MTLGVPVCTRYGEHVRRRECLCVHAVVRMCGGECLCVRCGVRVCRRVVCVVMWRALQRVIPTPPIRTKYRFLLFEWVAWAQQK